MRSIVAGTIFIATVALSLWSLAPPYPKSESEQQQLNALKAHVAALASDRHPLGSDAIFQHRERLVDFFKQLGLQVSVQKTRVVYENPRRGRQARVAWVENIVALLDVPDSDELFAVMSHYDSVAYGPGAADASSGTAAVMEAAAALAKGERPKRDVLFLLTDGEEQGLMGAQGFFRSHALAKRVQLVLNFEARGASGPSFMFETSVGNGALIKALRQGNSHTLANSLSYEIYQRMPNDTDATIALANGAQLLNFAFIDDFPRYHTAMDRTDILDDRSLFHTGTQALAMTNYFAFADEMPKRESDVTYFNILGGHWVSYGVVWLYGLFALVLVLVTLALRRLLSHEDGIRPGQSLLGLLLGVVVIISASEFIHSLMAWRFTVMSWNDEAWWSYLYQHQAYLPAYAVLAIGLMLWLLDFVLKTKKLGLLLLPLFVLLLLGVLGQRVVPTLVTGGILIGVVLGARAAKVRPRELLAGALVLWSMLATLLVVFVPHASYTAVWTLLPVALATWIRPNWSESLWGPGLVLAWFALLWSPIIYTFYLGLGIFQPQLVAVLILLPLLLVTVCCFRASELLIVTGIALVIFSWVTEGFDETHPRPSQLFVGVDANEDSAFLVADEDLSLWSEAQLGAQGIPGSLAQFVPDSQDQTLVRRLDGFSATTVDLSLVSRSSVGDTNTMIVHLAGKGTVENVSLWYPNADVGQVSLDGESLPKSTGELSRIRLLGLPPEGVDITFELQGSKEQLEIITTEQTVGWPEGVRCGAKTGG